MRSLCSITVGCLNNKYREVFSRVRSMCRDCCGSRAGVCCEDHNKLIPSANRNEEERVKSNFLTSPKFKEDGLCQQGKLQEGRGG